MTTPFKSILAVIDRVAASTPLTNTLFQNSDDITPEDRQTLESWAGKPLDQIRMILTPAFGKSQIQFDPFTETNPDPISQPVLLAFDDDESAPEIVYSVENTGYGQAIIASTAKGICYLVFFSGNEDKVPGILEREFAGSHIRKGSTAHLATALDYLQGRQTARLHLHVKGAADHLPIWKALSRVPAGKLVSYGTLAKATHRMAQDIGVAMGDNRIALLIPCHRVIKSTGQWGQYHWGAKRKQAMIIKEAVI